MSNNEISPAKHCRYLCTNNHMFAFSNNGVKTECPVCGSESRYLSDHTRNRCIRCNNLHLGLDEMFGDNCHDFGADENSRIEKWANKMVSECFIDNTEPIIKIGKSYVTIALIGKAGLGIEGVVNMTADFKATEHSNNNLYIFLKIKRSVAVGHVYDPNTA